MSKKKGRLIIRKGYKRRKIHDISRQSSTYLQMITGKQTKLTPKKLKSPPPSSLKRKLIRSATKSPALIKTPSKSPFRKQPKFSSRRFFISHKSDENDALCENVAEMDNDSDHVDDDNDDNGAAIKDDRQVMMALMPKVMEKLKQTGHDSTMFNFFKLISEDKFPTNNIAFLLWTEVVAWFSLQNTSQMRYSEETKKFWKLGWRIFGGKFIHFMGGFKNFGQVTLEATTKGIFCPEKSNINFAAPSFDVLRTFNPYGVDESIDRKPGMFDDAITAMFKALNGKSACLSYDGKKLKQGLTDIAGDIDILGFEEGKSLAEKREQLKRKTDLIDDVSMKLNTFRELHDVRNLPEAMKTECISVLKFALKDLSASMIEIQNIRIKQEIHKEKLIERGGDQDWRKGKYVYAVSAIIAFLYDVDKFLENAHETNERLCQVIAYMNNAPYVTGRNINLEKFEKYVELEESDNVENSRLIKQRTLPWFEIRKQAMVTGSTVYKAIGLDGLQKQKDYFDEVICKVPPKEVPSSVKEMMDYGTKNEPNAMATLIAKVLPVIHPNVYFCEEGCVEIHKDNKVLMVVSPDGSLRTDKDMETTFAATEFKCPVYKLQTEVPSRYVLQCLSEIEVFDVESLIYLCWRPDYSSVFVIKRDADLFGKVICIIDDLYGMNNPRKPIRLSQDVKELKDSISKTSQSAQFIGLFPSVVANSSIENEYMSKGITNEILLEILAEVKSEQLTCYDLCREKATEGVVFLCCDLDRSWNKEEVQCSPVCWFPKGYSLTTEVLRKVAEEVRNRCHDSGIHIPCDSFDGQWHNIVVRSLDGKPLTVLQLQKDVWKSVEKSKKSEIVHNIKELNKNPDYEFRDGKFICTNHDQQLPSLSHFNDKTATKDDDGGHYTEQQQVSLLDVIPESISNLDAVQKDVLAFLEVDNDVDFEMDIITSNVNEELWADVLNSKESDSTDKPLHTDMQSAPANEVIEGKETQTQSTVRKLHIDDAASILTMLKTDGKCNKKNQWTNKSCDDILTAISSVTEMSKLRDIDIRIISRYVNKIHGSKIVKENATKRTKIDKFAEIWQMENVSPESKRNPRKRNPKKVKKLADLCTTLLTKTFSKHQLNIVYAEYIWPKRYREWIEQSPLCNSPVIDNTAVPEFWFYIPEFSEVRKQLEVRCIDSSHLFTRMRRKSCSGGLDGISNDAWKNVARSKATFLTQIMIEEIVEPMSVPMAVTHFSESVEHQMRINGDEEAADLVKDIRHWWESEDAPGVEAFDRIRLRLDLRKRLLSKVDFGNFPPPTFSICGWPLQLWEALVASIDAKALLYAICENGTYNVRAFSSMMNETFFSELTQQDKRGHGTLTSMEFGRFIGNTIEQLQLRLDPERAFTYRTSRSTAYKLVEQEEAVSADMTTENVTDLASPKYEAISLIALKEREKLVQKKEAFMSRDRNSIERGTLGVRYEKARRNESKLLVSDRMGI